MSRRGFIASGALPLDEVTELAAAAAELGYDCFWTTVPAGGQEPAALIEAAAAGADSIELGLGLVPLDRFAGDAVGRALLATGVDPGRIVCTLGVGRHVSGAADFWRRGAAAFGAAAPGIRLAVGSYGPQVLRAGGELADAVLLNWMTPARARWALERFAAGAEAAGRDPSPPLYVIVNTAARPAEIDAALATYGLAPYHRRHQEAVGAGERLGTVVESSADVERELVRWDWATPLVLPLGADTPAARRRLQALAARSG